MRKKLIIKILLAATITIFVYGCSNSKKDSTKSEDGDSTNNQQPPQTESVYATEDEQKQQMQEELQKRIKDSLIKTEPKTPDEVNNSFSVPSELKYCHQSSEFLFDKFYPIGWSKDGKFAYIIEPADEASGLYHFEIRVQNMISNAIVWSWTLEEEIEKSSVREMWKDYSMTFATKLNSFGIIQQKKIKLEPTEFTVGDKKFKATIENQMETNTDYGFDVVKTTEAFIKSAQLGTKKIYSYTEEDYSMVLGATISGVLISPYQERVAVLIQTERWGYEGPPDVISFIVVGTNLNETFKK